MVLLLFLLANPAFCVESAEVKHGAFLGAKTTAMPAWFKDSFLDLAEDIADGKDQGKRIMVYFHQDGCPYCNLLVEENFADESIKSRMQQSLDVVEINMWGDREVISVNGRSLSEKQFAVAKKVQFTPTLLFFNERGKEVLRLNGYLPPAEFKLALDYVIGKNEENLKFSKFVKQNLTPGGELIAEPDLFLSGPVDLQKLKAGGKPFTLFFEAGNCQSCEKLHKNVLADPDTRNMFKKLNSLQLDINSSHKLIGLNGAETSAKQLAEDLNVNFVPTIIFMDGNGKEIIRSEAMFKIFHSQSMADYVVSGTYKTEGEFQRYLSARAEKIRETGQDVDIWK